MNWLEERKRQIAEERRQQELDAKGGIEERAIYSSQKEAQKSYDKVKKTLENLTDEFENHYSPSAINKQIKLELEATERTLRSKYEKEADSIKNKIAIAERILKNIAANAKEDGFDIKRSEDFTNVELRAKLETEKDYQKYLDAKIAESNKYRDEAREIEQNAREEQQKLWDKAIKKANALREKANAIFKEAYKVYKEGEDKGFNLDTSKYKNY